MSFLFYDTEKEDIADNNFLFQEFPNDCFKLEEDNYPYNNNRIIKEIKESDFSNHKIIEKSTNYFTDPLNNNAPTSNKENIKNPVNNEKNDEDKNEKNDEDKNEKKKCGRKRERPGDDKNEHNKFSDDNIRRKVKHLVLKHLMDYINKQIKILYNGNIGNGVFKKELQTLNQSQKSDATINFNKEFIERKINEIFSENISGRFTNFPLDHNKILIQKLLMEEDEKKRKYFNELFDLNFKQCLGHFRGNLDIKILNGMKCFNDIKDSILKKYTLDGKEYIDSLEYYLNNFEEIINNKKARKPRPKKKKEL